jgi:hemerythrin-like metal-binding protein
MNFTVWTNEMGVGVVVLDDDHKKLIGIINQLHFEMEEAHDKKVLGAVLDQFVEYSKAHFSRDQSLLFQAGYPDAPEHEMEHEWFIHEISALTERFASAPAATLDMELMKFLRNWLDSHVESADRKYGPFLNAAESPSGTSAKVDALKGNGLRAFSQIV